MEAGAAEHEVLTVLERRRTLREYGLSRGERHFHVPLYAASLGLRGVLDLLIIVEGRYYVVEFKDTTQPLQRNAKLQVAAYALLVEEGYGVTVAGAFVYRIPLGRIDEVALTATLRGQVRAALKEIQAMLAAERMPAPTPRRGRCVDCEYRRFCGDVV
jgi:CRISPR-associated exonuclease Cas4